MRILQINKFHYPRGGAERVYFETARILENKGHKVAYFAMDDRRNLPTPWRRYFAPYVDFNAPALLWRRFGIVARFIYNRAAAGRLDLLLTEFKPDVAHLHNIYHQLSPSVIYTLRKHHIPIVVTLHDYKLISPCYNLSCNGRVYTRCLRGRYYRCLIDRCVKNSYVKSALAVTEAYLYHWLNPWRFVHTFIAPSIFLRETFQADGFDGAIVHLANPLVIPKLSKQTFVIGPYILYAGRLSPEKGVATLIDAYAQAQPLQSKLVIAGTGPQTEQLRQQVAQLDIADRVVFLGHVTHENVFSLMAGAQAVVIPSVCYENAPYTAREAAVLTKNVICSKVGGLFELVGVSDRVYEPGDVGALVGHLQVIDALPETLNQSDTTYSNETAYYRQLIGIYRQAVAATA